MNLIRFKILSCDKNVILFGTIILLGCMLLGFLKDSYTNNINRKRGKYKTKKIYHRENERKCIWQEENDRQEREMGIRNKETF